MWKGDSITKVEIDQEELNKAFSNKPIINPVPIINTCKYMLPCGWCDKKNEICSEFMVVGTKEK